ncbi:MAG: hypothetical protein PHX08_14980 [Lachnospiraceae bacterium]|nr:hypothetical protein [Lachnospiraceae bacterium]
MKLIPLNIAMDYPVYWSLEKIIRDLIQNFYDSIGYMNFAREFQYSWIENENRRYTVKMRVQGHPFNYEWLTCIGGSTKTDLPGEYAGMYGEGFKMCMLCLERLEKYDITMESQAWRINPCQYKENIEGRETVMLGYELRSREDDGWTQLVIDNVEEGYLRAVEQGLLDFFYPENPLFGEKIADEETYAIYGRSEKLIPCIDRVCPEGILYCNYMARGKLPFSLIILKKGDMRNSDTRNREVLEDSEVKRILYHLFKEVNPEISYRLLIELKKYWNDLPQKSIDLNSWYYSICQLVRNVSMDEKLCAKFQCDYSNLVYIDRKTLDKQKNKQIEETKKWYQENAYGYMVNPVFRLLGAKSLIVEYQKQRLQLFEEIQDKERSYVDLLFQICDEIIPWKLYEQKPIIVIQKDSDKNYDPLFFAESNFSKTKAKLGYLYHINKVIMKHSDFRRGQFRKTLLKFVDILIHTFGTNKSARVNVFLTELGNIFLKNSSKLQDYEEKWDAGERLFNERIIL